MVDEAEKLGLVSDKDFTKYYRSYPQAQLYSSRTLTYQAIEFIRLRRGRGIRSLKGYPASANLVLDKSVITRVRSEPAEHKQLELYRPENVLEFFRTHKHDLPGYFKSLGLDAEEPILPSDVLRIL